MDKYRCFLMGANTRVIRCGDILLEMGHQILGVISGEQAVQRWAEERKLMQINPNGEFLGRLQSEPFDLFFSIDNNWKVPGEVLTLPRIFAINFHDAPLPRYAGINATNWAIINRETSHGISWHVMTDRIDAGDILKAVTIPLSDRETAMTLNAKCYEKSIEAFVALMDDFANNRIAPVRQNEKKRTYFPRWKRPSAACTIDWTMSAEQIEALVRGVDFGSYPNPMGLAKMYLNDRAIAVKGTTVLPSRSDAAPATILKKDSESIQVTTKTQDIVLSDFCSLEGEPLTPSDLMSGLELHKGSQFPRLPQTLSETITRVNDAVCRHEESWVDRLMDLDVFQIPFMSTQRLLEHKSNFSEIRCTVDDVISMNRDTNESAADMLAAALILYFHRIGGKDSFDVGFRDVALERELSGAEAYFSSHVPLRVDIDATQSFNEHKRQLWQQIQAAKTLGPYARDLFCRFPRLRDAFKKGERFSLPVVIERVERLPVQKPTVDADLVVIIPDGAEEIAWWFDQNVLDRETTKRMHEQLSVLLNEIGSRKERPVFELSIVPETERRKMVAWNQTQADYPKHVLLHELFEAQVERTPDQVAVSYQGLKLSYLELNRRANQLAHNLKGIGVGPDTLVGVCMERSLEMVVALYGILKAGGAYVPIDPEYPPERVVFMVDDASVPVLLTQSWLQNRLPFQSGRVLCLDTDWQQIVGEDTGNLSSTASDMNLAYMIYTSGSTGKPKGALNTHRSICSRLLWMQSHFGLTRKDSVIQKTPFSFDVSVWEFFWPLIAGAQLIVAKPGGHRDAAYLVKTIKEQKITVAHFVPSMLRAFLEEPGVEDCRSLRHVVCSGEALHFDLQEEFFRLLPAQLHNLYGPTEAAVDVTYWSCESHNERKFVPIGQPVANTQIHILDLNLQQVPIGIPGELHIGGIQVGRGYHNRPELTQEKFIPDPFGVSPDARLYKTGDLCRWLEDGVIEYLGRADFQVKIRGLRVELGEIESVVIDSPLVKSCAVMAPENMSGDRRLVAYVVWQQGKNYAVEELRSYLKQRLPEYMVPSLFVSLDNLPLSPNGKVDRRALPAPVEDPLASLGTNFTDPDNKVERQIAKIWKEVLGIPRVSRDSNFFDLGGDSLGLIRVRSRLQRAFDKEIDIIDLFRCTTVQALARHLEARPDESTLQWQSHDEIETRKAAAVRRRRLRQSIIHESRVGTDESTT